MHTFVAVVPTRTAGLITSVIAISLSRCSVFMQKPSTEKEIVITCSFVPLLVISYGLKGSRDPPPWVPFCLLEDILVIYLLPYDSKYLSCENLGES